MKENKKVKFVPALDKEEWSEKLDRRFFSSFDLINKGDVVYTIEAVGEAELQIYGKTGKITNEMRTTVKFVEQDKPFALNATNIKKIQKYTKTVHLNDSIGKKIKIGISQEMFFGEMRDCLRIRDVYSEELETLSFINESQVNEIKNLLTNLEGIFSEAEMLSALKKNSISEITEKQFEGLKKRLLQKIQDK